MKQIVLGRGEIGTAIQKILECDSYDVRDGQPPEGQYDVLHVCFPCVKDERDRFVQAVRFYEKKYAAELVIVHSTVPVGTCDEYAWVHSPVRGIHPELEQGIRTFVKFFGGTRALEAAAIFRDKGLKTMTTLEARETEALKLWDTTMYGWDILIAKAIKAYCGRNGLDFRTVYTLANATYNSGYAALGHPEFTRYVLKDKPGPIGGHCVRQNWELLEDPIADIAKTLHKELTGE